MSNTKPPESKDEPAAVLAENAPEHRNSASNAKGDFSRSTYAPVPGEGQTRACTDPWTFVQVLGNGQTRPCCFSGLVLGFVSDETSFEDVYNGEVAQNLRRELLVGELDRFCKICNMKAIVPVEEFQQQISVLYNRNDAHVTQKKEAQIVSAQLHSEESALRMQYAPFVPPEKVSVARRIARALLPYALRDWINRSLAA